MLLQPATIPSVPLERPPVPNSHYWAAPEDSLSETLHLLGLHGAPIGVMGASNMLRGNLGCGSVRAPPDGPVKIEFGQFPVWELLKQVLAKGDSKNKEGPALC